MIGLHISYFTVRTTRSQRANDQWHESSRERVREKLSCLPESVRRQRNNNSPIISWIYNEERVGDKSAGAPRSMCVHLPLNFSRGKTPGDLCTSVSMKMHLHPGIELCSLPYSF